MNLSREQIQVIESLGFTLNETNNYQKEGDWQTYYLIIKDSMFFIEVQQTLIEEDGSLYDDYYKEYPEEGESITEFITNFFN